MLTIKQLQKIAPILALKAVCTATEIDYQSLRRKVLSGKELDVQESRKLEELFVSLGFPPKG